MGAFLAGLLGHTYLRYGLASLVALAGDVGLFMAGLHLGMAPAAAAAFGYMAGILMHWLISSRLVFAQGVAASGADRVRQKALFVGSALIGLALTTGIVALGAMLGIMPLLAKALAVAVSFQATYMLRKAIVFA
ncbi:MULTISPECIES: GtrA family protein [unclassified Sphingobium]|uniref:GtrA family protein n=1 Tax=unclassified Sphingobium TaxID=2611147 RepID=UPI002224C02C|nr:MULTISPECIES: GtrA family protein [unclassified Sphingobium]MCW2386111.1 putative flippase GtrA [Sphingobium sp. B2D3D]